MSRPVTHGRKRTAVKPRNEGQGTERLADTGSGGTPFWMLTAAALGIVLGAGTIGAGRRARVSR